MASGLQSEVERRYGCTARFVQTVPVSAPLGVDRTWDVVVHIFDLEGCLMTNRAYAWSSEEVYVSLDIGPIRSPGTAVQATVADRLRQDRLARWERSSDKRPPLAKRG